MATYFACFMTSRLLPLAEANPRISSQNVLAGLRGRRNRTLHTNQQSEFAPFPEAVHVLKTNSSKPLKLSFHIQELVGGIFLIGTM
jgi:type IV secretory pathway VirB4 component